VFTLGSTGGVQIRRKLKNGCQRSRKSGKRKENFEGRGTWGGLTYIRRREREGTGSNRGEDTRKHQSNKYELNHKKIGPAFRDLGQSAGWTASPNV